MKELGEGSVFMYKPNNLDKERKIIPFKIGFYLVLCKFNYGSLNL